MLSILKKLFGIEDAPEADFKALMENGAVIIDVRTTKEFGTGHVLIARNLPIEKIPNALHQLKAAEKPIITCCNSGNRSAAAATMLKEAGIEAYNGGSWQKLREAIR
jgi:phage shock protein E